jgi:uncharacterized phage infection (PIP) family protein YhgE
LGVRGNDAPAKRQKDSMTTLENLTKAIADLSDAVNKLVDFVTTGTVSATEVQAAADTINALRDKIATVLPPA